MKTTRNGAAARLFSRPSLKEEANSLTIRRVLVPVDFSKPSLSAIEAALPLVQQFKAELHLMHVFAPDYPLSSMAAIPLIVPELEVRQRVRRKLRELAKRYSVSLHRQNVHALKGSPFEEICRLARDWKIDLIVIATRGNTGLKHLVLGSTAERVVRHSPCPVLVVRNNEADQTSTTGFRKILVPIDFSDCSMKGLKFGRRLARELGSKMILLNSVALQYYIANDEYARYDLPKLLQQTEKSARGQMRDFVAKTNWGGVEIDTTIKIGHAGEQICAAAAERADLIVIATHGHTGLKHIFLGSTAEYVVRRAPCPVLVVPSLPRVVPHPPSRK